MLSADTRWSLQFVCRQIALSLMMEGRNTYGRVFTARRFGYSDWTEVQGEAE